MKLEHSIQKRFLSIITKQEELAMPNEALEVYSELIYYRFLEVFQKAFPRFKKMISEEQFDTLIYKFLKIGAKTPIFWKVAGEFKNFVSESNDLDMPYLSDLLEFEFLEVEMFMSEYQEPNSMHFSLENCYYLSSEIELRLFSYPVHHPEFDTNPNNFEMGKYRIIFHYDSTVTEILYEEITPFVHEFLQTLTSSFSLNEHIKITSQKYEIQFDELLEILTPVLENFHSQNIILLHTNYT